MNRFQISRLGQLWQNALRDRTWKQSERAKLETVVRELQNNNLHLSEIRRLLGEMLVNEFFVTRMASTYSKYEGELKAQVRSLDTLLARKKMISSAMRTFYSTKQQLKLKDGSTIECDVAGSKAGKNLHEILGRYSYELVNDQFDRSFIKNITDEICSILKSSSTSELRTNVGAFLSSLESKELDEPVMANLIDNVIFDLVWAGHSESDLEDVGTSLTLAALEETETRKMLESRLLAVPSKWIILTSLEDLSLPDDKDVRIGNVTLHGITHEFSMICNCIRTATIEYAGKDVEEAIKEDAIKRVKDLRGKVSAEIVTSAYGSKKACEIAVQEISKMIDVLAIHDPNSVIREPRELPLHQITALNSSEGMLPSQSIATRPDITRKKDLNDNAVRRLQSMLQRIDQTLRKEPDNLNEFEHRIVNAMHFYRKGNYAFDPQDKVVNYFVSLECMLILPGERPSKSLPNRVLDVIGVMKENAREMKDLVEHAYRHRGGILHFGHVSADMSAQIASSLFEVNRRVMGILAGHLQDPRCDSLQHFLDVIHEETVANREQARRNALLEVNKEFPAEGLLKSSDGAEIGHAEFTFGYKDDGKYVYMLGSISKFKAFGTLSQDGQSIEEVQFKDRSGKFRIKLANSLHLFELFDLVRGRIEAIPFQATEFTPESETQKP
jgi:hypothetical protein